MVWNNVQGNFGGIGPRLPGARGEMRLKLRRLTASKTSSTNDGAVRVVSVNLLSVK
jgi:hypothetical protein